jgi:hypothetical protein
MTYVIPTISTDHLILRPLSAPDAAILHRIYQTEGVLQYFNRFHCRSRRWSASSPFNRSIGKFGYGIGQLTQDDDEIIGY